MALKIRLRVQGRKNSPFYRLVVADGRSPRDGKYLEAIGWYNPFIAEFDKSFYMKPDRIQHWLNLGAQFSESVHALVKKANPSITTQLTQKVVAKKAKALAKTKAQKAKKTTAAPKAKAKAPAKAKAAKATKE